MAGIDFYRTLTEVSFTLLGLWFAILRLTHGAWRTRARHRFTLHIALHFFLPGMIGLASQLSEGADDGGLFWRSAAAVAGIVGFFETLTLRYPADAGPPPPGWWLRLFDPIVYLALIAVAVAPPGLTGFAPLQLAGAVTGALFLVGLCAAWLAFAEPEPEPEPEPGPEQAPAGAAAPSQPGPGDDVTARVDLPRRGTRPRPGCRFSYLCTSDPVRSPAIRCETCPAGSVVARR